MSDLFSGNAAPKYNLCLGCGRPMIPGEVHVCNPLSKARNADPETSHKAAHKVVRSGKATAQRTKCLELVKSCPGMTAGEIQRELGFLAHKRLPELREARLVYNGSDRKCRVNGTMQMTWWPMDVPPAIPPFYDALGAVAE